jgi:hypothetical protein
VKALGLVVVFALSTLMAPLAANAQSVAKVPALEFSSPALRVL